MKIYIGCALTHVPRSIFGDYVIFIHQLAAALHSRRGHSIKYALMNSDPQLAKKPFRERASLCYTWDREMVEDADLMIAEASYPSLGLGIELQVAEQRGKPIIVAFQDFGNNKAEPVAYSNPDDSRHELQIGHGYVSLMALGIPGVFRVIRYSSPSEGIRRILSTVDLTTRD
jgi:hypothetical protein